MELTKIGELFVQRAQILVGKDHGNPDCKIPTQDECRGNQELFDARLWLLLSFRLGAVEVMKETMGLDDSDLKVPKNW